MTNKSLKIKNFLLKTLGYTNLIEYAKELGYSEENILVLQEEEEILF